MTKRALGVIITYHGFEGKSNRPKIDCRETDPWLKIRCHSPDEDHSRALRDERDAGQRYSPELMTVPRVKLKVGPCYCTLGYALFAASEGFFVFRASHQFSQ